MKQSATRPTGFEAAFQGGEGPGQRIRATRLRLHMPRQRARDEMRAWDDVASDDGTELGTEARKPPRRRDPR